MKLDKCTICGTSRFDEMAKLKWGSDLAIYLAIFYTPDIKKTIKSAEFTVCPKCRELKFNTILRKLMQKMTKESLRELRKTAAESERKKIDKLLE